MSELHVRVSLAGEMYALPVTEVIEVADVGEVTPLPGSPAAVLGVRNLRGQVVPVVDLAVVLGLPAAPAPERIVIAENAGRRAGLAVDDVAGVEQLPPASEETEAPHLAGAVLVSGDLIGVLDVRSVLDAVAGTQAS